MSFKYSNFKLIKYCKRVLTPKHRQLCEYNGLLLIRNGFYHQLKAEHLLVYLFRTSSCDGIRYVLCLAQIIIVLHALRLK